MNKKQLEKLGKFINLIDPSRVINMTIYVHRIPKKEALDIMKRIPKGFVKGSKPAKDSGAEWMEAVKPNVYGLSRLELTLFHLKEKGESCG